MNRMQRIFLLGVLSVMFFSMPAYADESVLKNIITVFPPEMLYEGKPIDPTCVYAAMRHRKTGAELRNSCDEIKSLQANDEGTSVVQSNLSIQSNLSLGYNYDLGDGRSGSFFYRYLGDTAEGLILYVYYSSGGSGNFSNLGVYMRDENVLRQIRTIAGGDRCSGGVHEAKIEDGHLLYAYYVTPAELYRKYSPNASSKKGLANGLINCGALIHAKDEKTESVELIEDMNWPDCFKEDYSKQVASKRVLSDIEAKEFIRKFSQACSAD